MLLLSQEGGGELFQKTFWNIFSLHLTNSKILRYIIPVNRRRVEQLAARRAHNPEAVGSSPTPAKKMFGLQDRAIRLKIGSPDHLRWAFAASEQWLSGGVPLFLLNYFLLNKNFVKFKCQGIICFSGI